MRCWSRIWVKGFSLVEIALVLIIIGVLAGMSLKGYRLVENARLKTVPLQVEQIRQAVVLFQERYHALPGDFSVAHEVIDARLANGNGDGRITGEGLSLQNSEAGWFWLHLIASGLWEEKVSSLDPPRLRMGEEIPTAKTGGGYTVSEMWQSVNGPWLVLGKPQGSAAFQPALTPVEAAELDALMDDGLPLTGNVRAHENESGHCFEAHHYALTHKKKGCVLYFKL